jgi:4-diphosphocytidyl-2-C-methyl-D-erythritol kinase
VTGRRADGYHLLRSEFVCIGIFDRLRIRVFAAAQPCVFLVVSGIPAPSGGENLAARAAASFLARCGAVARVEIRLEKRIPLGAGLGGGSSDAAAVLRALSRLVCPVPPADLRDWAVAIGADVPFFLDGRPSLVEGIGELISPLPTWPRGSLVVAFGGVPLATSEVFRRYDASLTSAGPVSTIRVSATGSGGGLSAPVNDLEAAAIRIEPGIEKLKEALLERGGSAVAMTGSGAAVFGFWPSPVAARRAAASLRASGWWAEATQILERAPEVEVEGEGDDGR